MALSRAAPMLLALALLLACHEAVGDKKEGYYPRRPQAPAAEHSAAGMYAQHSARAKAAAFAMGYNASDVPGTVRRPPAGAGHSHATRQAESEQPRGAWGPPVGHISREFTRRRDVLRGVRVNSPVKSFVQNTERECIIEVSCAGLWQVGAAPPRVPGHHYGAGAPDVSGPALKAALLLKLNASARSWSHPQSTACCARSRYPARPTHSSPRCPTDTVTGEAAAAQQLSFGRGGLESHLRTSRAHAACVPEPWWHEGRLRMLGAGAGPKRGDEGRQGAPGSRPS